jgi:isoquinoline 1-oxidoreductase beta subunit
MNMPLDPIRFSRRSFIAHGGATAIAVAFGVTLEQAQANAATASAATANASFTPNAWVIVGADDTVTIMSGQAEMGQGIMSGLSLLIAEDMDADWGKVRVVQSPSDPKIYGINGSLGTFGSTSTRTFYEKLRLVGAQTRRILMMNAADRWGVPLGEVSTNAGVLLHEKTGRSLSYGAIAATAKIPDPLPVLTAADLTPADKFRYIGKSVPRVDIPLKVNGTAIFGIDTQLPNMLYGAILRPVAQGEKPVAVDDHDALAVPGILKVVALPNGVGVIGETIEATLKAKLALKVKWSTDAKARNYTSAAVMADYRALVRDKSAPVATTAIVGDFSKSIAEAAKTMVREYTADHVAHFCMEPMNATALVDGDKVDVWASNQSPSNIKGMVAAAGKLSPDNVTVHSTFLGGGFGRRFEGDVGRDAYMLAKEMPGRPVKVIWTREDDVQNDPYRPLVAQLVEVGLDKDGNLTAWRQRIVGDSYMARTLPFLMEKLHGFDPLVATVGDPSYPTPAGVTEYIRQDRGINVGALRGISAGYTVFAVESMIDELAAEAKADPLAYRLAHMKDNPRGVKVLETAARMANWTEKRANRGLGIAYSSDCGSHTAMVAEISLDEAAGAIRVHKVWCASDVGIALQPRNVMGQLEGGIVFGIGPALYEQLNIRNGEIEEANFGEYRVMRMSDVPEIEIELIASAYPVGGVGEAGVPPISPAIANAFAQLTGKRIRQLPMLPARVKAVLHGEESV